MSDTIIGRSTYGEEITVFVIAGEFDSVSDMVDALQDERLATVQRIEPGTVLKSRGEMDARAVTALIQACPHPTSQWNEDWTDVLLDAAFGVGDG